jgi:protein-tyrosine phosphatase
MRPGSERPRGGYPAEQRATHVGEQPHVVMLCTGNAARSVMAGALLDADIDVRVTTRGTHVIEGLPMSLRTRGALAALGVRDHMHRSRQLTADDVRTADLIVGMAREHVLFIRRGYPTAAHRTGTLRRLARDLPGITGTLAERVAALALDTIELEPWEDVDDPAGGDEAVFRDCATEIDALLARLAPVLREAR